MPNMLTLTWATSPDELPPDALIFFAPLDAATPLDAITDTLPWYRLLIATALPAQSAAAFALVRCDARLVAVFPLLRHADRQFSSLTTPYSCLYRPLFAPDLDAASIRRIAACVARAIRPQAALRLECLDPDWPHFAPCAAGLRDGGLVVLRFRHFGNWRHHVAGQSWAGYLASRSGALRETIRRRGAKIRRDPSLRLELVRDGPRLALAIAGFEAVYAQSWKNAEPHPDFNAAMMQLCAEHSVLRLAVLWRDEQAIAVQYWLVSGGTAQILKLAHDTSSDHLSPGTVLTAWVIAHLLDHEAITTLDFGRGDDAYKQLWAESRQQRVGLIAANPYNMRGFAMITRHALGHTKRRLMRLAGLQHAEQLSRD
jgi:hypothetical protein